ncbi:MAG: hypothetical protein JO106_06860 [Mycobacterium sp.]|nr:hypothetical protein [Mycobacterium sp.]
MDFAMRYDRWYRPWATLFGLGPKWTTIRVVDDILHVKHGWAFCIDVPLKDIKSARLICERPFALGVHPMGDAWLVNGSRHGIVELKFARPVTSKTAKLWAGTWAEVRCLYISLTEPDGFIGALKSRI